MMWKFRLATIDDLPDIVQTYNSTIPSRLVTADTEPVTVESRQTWFKEHNPENRPIWVVEYGGKYAGWMAFSTFYGRPAYENTVEISIYLEEAFRKLGLGKLCIKHAKTEARKMAIHTLLGFIFAHNTVSINLFEKSGFQKWALLPAVAKLDGTLRDLVIMGLKI